MSEAHRTPGYRAWDRKAYRYLIASGDHTCVICGYPIDVTLPRTDPEGPSIEHLDGVETDPTPPLERVALAHLRCNREAGARKGGQHKNPPTPPRARARTTRASTSTRTPQPKNKSATNEEPVSSNIDGSLPPPPARNLSMGSRKGRKGTEKPKRHPDGFWYPRIETRPPRAVSGSYGPRCREWLAEHVGLHLRGWQAYAVDRALEHDADGALVWSEVLLTVARQSGKSTLARGVVLWRMHEGPELFGQDQLVISAANKLPTAWEVMYPALQWVRSTHGDGCVREGNNRPGIALPSARWVPVAAKRGAGTGYSTTMLFVDEVWQIPERVVDDDLEPTLAEAESGQIWMTSTAGDSESTLFKGRRARAIEQTARDTRDDEAGDRVLILEWSAPPDADVDDEDTWRWASPEWTDKRVAFLRDKHRKSTNVDSFKTQYLNQWVKRIDGWLNSRTYELTRDPDRPLPADAAWSVCVEMSRDGASHAVATAALDGDGRMVIRLVMARTYRDVDVIVARIRAEHPRTTLTTTPFYRGRLTANIDSIIGSSEVGAATGELLRSFREGVIAHDGAPILEEHLFASDVRKLDGAYKLVSASVDVDAHGARAVLFAVWLASAVPAPVPMIATRRRG